MLIFSLENNTDPDAAAPYHLETHGRYTHRQLYVEQLLCNAGLRPEVVHAELRTESGVPVPGLVVRATKGEVIHG